MYFLKKKVFLWLFFSIFLIEFFLFAYFLKIDLYNYFLASISPDSLLVLANKDRESRGLMALENNSVLAQAALMKANHMAENGYFAHTSPDNISPWHWLKEAGYEFSCAGENLAVNFSDSVKLHQAWIDSPNHRANIINYNFTQVGIASAKGIYKGREAVFVVQFFGQPKEIKAVSGAEALKREVEVATAKDVEVKIAPQVLSEQVFTEEKENYESFVAISQDENSENLSFISNVSTERKEFKYVPLFDRINRLLGGTVKYALFLLYFLATALILKISVKNLKVYEAVANSALILLVIFSTLYFNSLLIAIISAKI